VAGPVEFGFLLRRRASFAGAGLDREEADGTAPRAEPGRAEVGVEGSGREAGGGGRGAERGGGLGEDGMAETGKEAGVGGVEREREGSRRGGGDSVGRGGG
jgi:hypothetical protein